MITVNGIAAGMRNTGSARRTPNAERRDDSQEVMRYPVSDHCDGERFFNVDGEQPRGTGDLLKWWRTRVTREWPASVPAGPVPPLPVGAPEGRIAATFIGHSTFLIQTGRSSILTDPVFTSHAGPFGRFGPRRVRPPAHAIAELPSVDVVLVSHNHYDHMQPHSLRELDARFRPAFVTTLGNAGFLHRIGLRRVTELDWWSHERHRGRRDYVHAGPALLSSRPARPQSNAVGRLRRQSRREDDLLHG